MISCRPQPRSSSVLYSRSLKDFFWYGSGDVLLPRVRAVRPAGEILDRCVTAFPAEAVAFRPGPHPTADVRRVRSRGRPGPSLPAWMRLYRGILGCRGRGRSGCRACRKKNGRSMSRDGSSPFGRRACRARAAPRGRCAGARGEAVDLHDWSDLDERSDHAGVLATCPRSARSRPLELSVVIPCLNEATTIAVVHHARARGDGRARHRAAKSWCRTTAARDGSIAIATAGGRARRVLSDARATAPRCSAGFQHARGRYVIMGDADQSYDFSLVPRFIDRARERLAVRDRIAAARPHRGRRDAAAPPLSRHARADLDPQPAVRDAHLATATAACAASSASTFFTLGVVSPGMEFASEMIVKAAVHGVADRRSADRLSTRIGATAARTCVRSATAGGTCGCSCGTRRTT